MTLTLTLTDNTRGAARRAALRYAARTLRTMGEFLAAARLEERAAAMAGVPEADADRAFGDEADDTDTAVVDVDSMFPPSDAVPVFSPARATRAYSFPPTR